MKDECYYKVIEKDSEWMKLMKFYFGLEDWKNLNDFIS